MTGDAFRRPGCLTFFRRSATMAAYIPVAAVAGVFVLVAMILATMAASRGEDYRYPLTLRFVR